VALAADGRWLGGRPNYGYRLVDTGLPHSNRAKASAGTQLRTLVKGLVLTSEGERLRDQFWRNLLTDPGPLGPIDQGDLRTLTRLLAKLDQEAD
jgi:hypothetical protein